MNLHFRELSPCSLTNVADHAKRIHYLVNATISEGTEPIVETAHGIVQSAMESSIWGYQLANQVLDNQQPCSRVLRTEWITPLSQKRIQ
jgi:hypothetical protein